MKKPGAGPGCGCYRACLTDKTELCSRSRAFSMRSQTHSPVRPSLRSTTFSFSLTGRRTVSVVIGSPGYFAGRCAGLFSFAIMTS